MDDARWFDRVPKVELHVHLEGAIPHDTLWELIQKYGGDPAIVDVRSLEGRFRYRDFNHFLEMWTWKNQYLREYDDFALIAEAIARDFASQNIRYVEAFFSPGDFAHHGLRPQGIARALRRGLARVEGTRVSLIADVVRNYGPERAKQTIEEVAEVSDQGVLGIGLGGAEPAFPPRLFRAAYDLARRLGFRTTAHAGEASGAESIWGAIRELGVDRIGHGTRAEEDDALLGHLAAEGTPLEMCPLSNVRTGVVATIEEHPIRRFLDRGIRMTVNTDDPKMFQTSLSLEYAALESQLGLAREQIRSLILSGIECSWLSGKEKTELMTTFVEDPAWPGQQPVEEVNSSTIR